MQAVVVLGEASKADLVVTKDLFDVPEGGVLAQPQFDTAAEAQHKVPVWTGGWRCAHQ